MTHEVKFDQQSRYQSRGRNGWINTTGVAIFDMGEDDFGEIHLHPITSKGKHSDTCRICIRKSAIPALIEQLQSYVKL